MKNNPNPEDLISVFVQDIVSKLEPIPAYNSQDDDQKANFKTNLYGDFLEGISKSISENLLAVAKQDNDYEVIETLLNSQNITEFLNSLGLIIGTSSLLMEHFLDYTVMIYLNLCTQFKVLADIDLVAFSKKLSIN